MKLPLLEKLHIIGAGAICCLIMLLFAGAILMITTKGCAPPNDPKTEPEPVQIEENQTKWELDEINWRKPSQRLIANTSGLHQLDLMYVAFNNLPVAQHQTLEYFKIHAIYHQARAKYLENISIAAYALDWGDPP